MSVFMDPQNHKRFIQPRFQSSRVKVNEHVINYKRNFL